MKSGDILLFPANDWVGRLVEWGTDSEYSHVAVCVSPQMELAIEASAGRVRTICTRNLKRNYDIFRVRPEYPLNINGVVCYLTNNLNAHYDYLGVTYLGLLKVLGKLGLPTQWAANKFQRDNDFFCSELCYDAFHIGGRVDLVPGKGFGSIVSPGDIATSSVVERVQTII